MLLEKRLGAARRYFTAEGAEGRGGRKGRLFPSVSGPRYNLFLPADVQNSPNWPSLATAAGTGRPEMWQEPSAMSGFLQAQTRTSY